MESRVRTALMLYGFAVVGLFLLVTPWTAIWRQAVVALLPESVGASALSGWVRGAVSGLGALNLAVAFQLAFELWHALHDGAGLAGERDGE